MIFHCLLVTSRLLLKGEKKKHVDTEKPHVLVYVGLFLDLTNGVTVACLIYRAFVTSKQTMQL